MNTIFKAAAFAATLFFAGAAFAEEPQHAEDNSAVLTQVYAAMDARQELTFEAVMASAERRMEAKIANLDVFANPAPAPEFVLASR